MEPPGGSAGPVQGGAGTGQAGADGRLRAHVRGFVQQTVGAGAAAAWPLPHA
jgi:hypothetical protein